MGNDADGDDDFELDVHEKVEFDGVEFKMPLQFLESNYPATRIGILKAYRRFHRENNAVQRKFRQVYDEFADKPFSEAARVTFGEPLLEGFHLGSRFFGLKSKWDWANQIHSRQDLRYFFNRHGLTREEQDECLRIDSTILRTQIARVKAYQRYRDNLGPTTVETEVSLASGREWTPLQALGRVRDDLAGRWGVLGDAQKLRLQEERELYLRRVTSTAAEEIGYALDDIESRDNDPRPSYPGATNDDFAGFEAAVRLRTLLLIEEDLQTLKAHIESTSFDALQSRLLDIRVTCRKNNPVERSLKSACDLTKNALQKIPSAVGPYTTVEQLDDDIKIVNGLSAKFEKNLRDRKEHLHLSGDSLPNPGEPRERPSDNSLFKLFLISDDTRRQVLQTRIDLYLKESELRIARSNLLGSPRRKI